MKTADAGNPGTWNSYAYVAGDPINAVDPRGTDLMYIAQPGAQDCINDPSQDGCWDPCQPNPYADGLLEAPMPECTADPVGGGPPDEASSGPDCNALVAAVGFAGLTYGNATEVWNDLAATAGKNSTAVAALGVVTWAGESGFAVSPTNNGNLNGSVDIGPLQLNYPLWKSAVSPSQWQSVFGTNLKAGQAFNGNADANIEVGLTYLNTLYKKFGNQAAGLYTGRNNPNRKKRQGTFDQYGTALENLFSNKDCFPDK